MIESKIRRPAMNQGPRVEIFNAANSQRLLILHSLGAGELRFRPRPARCRSLLRAIEMPVIAVALDRNASGLANGMLQRGDALLLWCGRPGHVENFFFHDRPVQIVHTITERNLRQRQTQANPISSQMIDVIEINAADGEIAKLLNRGRAFDMSQHCRLGLEGERDKAAEAGGFILKLAKLSQMIDTLLEGFNVAIKHGASAATTHPMPGPVNVEPFLGGFFAAANPVSDVRIKDFRAASGDGT